MKLTPFLDAVAEALGVSPALARSMHRALRTAGVIETGPTGRGARDMTAKDAGAMTLAFLATLSPIEAVAEHAYFAALRSDGPIRVRSDWDWDPGTTLGELTTWFFQSDADYSPAGRLSVSQDLANAVWRGPKGSTVLFGDPDMAPNGKADLTHRALRPRKGILKRHELLARDMIELRDKLHAEGEA